MASAEERKLELERKKQKLAELREDKRRREEERRRNLLRSAPLENGATNIPRNFSQKELEEILEPLGIPSQPQTEQTTSSSKANDIIGNQRVTSSPRVLNLSLTETQIVSVPPKKMIRYCKTTQTDDDRTSAGEFSLGSQEFDYDEEMAMTDKHLDINFDESPTREIANILPNFHFGRQKLDQIETVVEKEQRIPGLSEEEKLQILSSQKFQNFLGYSASVVERLLAEEASIFIDYTRDYEKDEKGDSGEKLTLSKTFVDEKWSAGRPITGIDTCAKYPELIAVSYGEDCEAVCSPVGVVQVWNNRFKKSSAEFTFYCQSKVTSVAFAKFHPNLILGGCYSGQICMWDNRLDKKTPVNKSSLTTQAHTHPIFSMSMVGSQNAHNLLSVSVDGRLCSWSVDNLNTPIDVIDLSWKQKEITCTCMSFAYDDVNNFVVGSQEGNIYTASRHGSKGGVNTCLQGHFGPVVSIDTIKGSSDLSHLFLSCSTDWTVKLWSTKGSRLLCSFEKHGDYVADIACSPVNPAVFASADIRGNLFLWNLNDDLEAPISQIQITGGFGIRKMMWMQNGQHLVVGDEKGNVYLYEVHESLVDRRPDDISKLARTLRDLKQASEEGDESLEVASKGSAAGYFSMMNMAGTPSTVQPARQQWQI